MSGAFKNSKIGDTLATTVMPGASAISRAMRGKNPAPPAATGRPAYSGTPPASGMDAAMHQMADQLHPVAPIVPITPNRVTGEFSK